MPPTLADLDWPLPTERLSVRPCRVDDAVPVFALRTRPEVAMWTHSVPVGLDGWRERFDDPAIAPHVLTVELDGEVIGEVIGELMARVRRGGPEGGQRARRRYRCRTGLADRPRAPGPRPSYRGRPGIGGSLLRPAVPAACHGLRLSRPIDPWRAMEKLGMRLETRSRRDTLHRDLGWVDARVYALLADESGAST